MKFKIVQLVDTIDYVKNNCFQSQLMTSLNRSCDLVQIEMKSIMSGGRVPACDGIISCLKQRTLFAHAQSIGNWLDGHSIVIYDQDPWQSYMDDSPYKGAYELISKHIYVRTFALTTQWWVDYLKARNLPAIFVKMWVLPEYCGKIKPYLEREFVSGFVGTVHPRRRQLIDIIEKSGVSVHVGRSGLSYLPFLQELQRFRCFVHNEDMPIYVDGQELNFNTGMWVKDIEAASQGCYSIRGKGAGSETYLENVSTVLLYENIEEVPDIIRSIEKMDPTQRQASLDQTAQFIRETDVWHETASQLIAAAVA